LQAIERDLSLERLKHKGHTIQGFLELGELRLDQGKLEEAQRFFEKVLEKYPEHIRAARGLAYVYYRQGMYGKAKELFDRLVKMYPLSDALQEDLERVRSKLNTTAELGLRIHEDNRGVSEIGNSVEVYFPSFTYPKLAARYRYEGWEFEDLTGTARSYKLSAGFEYILNHRSKAAFSFAPETFTGRQSVAGYQFYGVTGTQDLHLALSTGRQAFKENVATALRGMSEDPMTVTLFGDLHERARISQSVTTSELSDGNARRRFDTKLLYFLVRRGIPLLSLELNYYQAGYERQAALDGTTYPYWSPGAFTGTQASISWERGIGGHWWWGISTHFIKNAYRDAFSQTIRDQGAGILLHLSYRMETGRLHAEFADTIRDYYRERTLGVFGSFDL